MRIQTAPHCECLHKMFLDLKMKKTIKYHYNPCNWILIKCQIIKMPFNQCSKERKKAQLMTINDIEALFFWEFFCEMQMMDFTLSFFKIIQLVKSEWNLYADYMSWALILQFSFLCSIRPTSRFHFLEIIFHYCP